MNESYPSPWSDQNTSGLTCYDEQSLAETTKVTSRELQGKWLPVLLVSVYFLSLWDPPFLPIPDIRWYMVLGLGIVTFLAQGSRLDMHAASLLWVVYGLSFAGALISLIRAPNFDLALWNTVGLAISFVAYLLFLPVLATRRARWFLLILLIGVAILWTIEIQLLVRNYDTLIYSTFGTTGSDKNHIGLNLALAGTASFYLAAFWKPPLIRSNFQLRVIRFIFGVGGVWFFYNMSLIYARFAILTALVGIGAVLVVMWIKGPRSLTGVLKLVLTISVFLIIALLLAPKVLEISPVWERLIKGVKNQGFEIFSDRELLTRKALFLISKNPFLGVGVGGTRSALVEINNYFPFYLIHNTYLSEWAEKGLLGLLSYVIWIIVFLKFLYRKFFSVPIHDQVWLLLLIPFFFMINSIDMSSISAMLLAIFSGIFYENYLLDHPTDMLSIEPTIGV